MKCQNICIMWSNFWKRIVLFEFDFDNIQYRTIENLLYDRFNCKNFAHLPKCYQQIIIVWIQKLRIIISSKQTLKKCWTSVETSLIKCRYNVFWALTFVIELHLLCHYFRVLDLLHGYYGVFLHKLNELEKRK